MVNVNTDTVSLCQKKTYVCHNSLGQSLYGKHLQLSQHLPRLNVKSLKLLTPAFPRRSAIHR